MILVPTRSDFTKWTPPTVLLEKADLARLEIGDLFYVGSKTGHLREAWVLGKIGKLVDAAYCRLTDADPPDGLMQIGGSTIPVEVTVLLDPERRWGDELKSGGPAHLPIQHVSRAEMKRAEENNAAWLEKRIGAKLAYDDKYPANTVLAIYHNTNLWNFESEKIRDELEEASRLRRNNIIGSIILFDGALYGQETLAKLRMIQHEPKPAS